MAIIYKKKTKPLAPLPVRQIPDEINDRLGSGLAQPLEVNQNKWRIADGLDKVEQNMRLVLTTPIGRHFLQPDFGSMLPFLIFEVYNPVLRDELMLATKEALRLWVKGVVIRDVVIDESSLNDNTVIINVVYSVDGTSVVQTFSLPVPLSQDDTIKLPPERFTYGGKRFLQ